MHSRVLMFFKSGEPDLGLMQHASEVAFRFYQTPPRYIHPVKRLDIIHDRENGETSYRPIISLHGFRQTTVTVVQYWSEPRDLLRLFDGSGRIFYGSMDLAELDLASSEHPLVEGIVQTLYLGVRIALRFLYLDYEPAMEEFKERQIELALEEQTLKYSPYLAERFGLLEKSATDEEQMERPDGELAASAAPPGGTDEEN